MLIIKNARVIDPASGFDEKAHILADAGKVVSILLACENSIERMDEASLIQEKEAQVIDAEGLIAAPGLIDVHVHFRDPGQTEKEDIMTGAAAAAAGGYTTVICMANTVPPIDTPERLAANLEKGSQTGIHVLQASTITKGMAGEELADLAALKEAGAACFTDDGKPLMNTELVLAAMRKAKELGMVLSFHEEDPRMITQQGINEGVAAMMLGLGSAPARSEAIMVQRDARFAQAAGARIDIQHVSSGLSVNIIRNAKAEGVDIWAEATPHHFSLTEEAVAKFGPNARMNPPLRSEIDRQAIIQGLKDGTIAMIATDHAPHTKEEKERPFQDAPSGIIGLETALALGITNLVEPEHLTMPELLAKMTCNPAACFSLDAGCEEAPEKAAGHLIEGGPADIVLFDPEEKWTVGETFVSKASNSPFVGAELTGKVKYTICSGKIVYQDA